MQFLGEKLFGRKVDVLTKEGIKNIRVKKVAQEIERSLIYV
jgi:predicted nucleotidyltransferase